MPDPNVDVRIVLYDGKYTYVRYKEGGQQALRYDEPWRDLTGDGFILAMAQEIESLQEQTDTLRKFAQFLDERKPSPVQLAVGNADYNKGVTAALAWAAAEARKLADVKPTE